MVFKVALADEHAVSQTLANVPQIFRQPDFRISGFPEYEDQIGKLPDEQQQAIDRIAGRIVSSQSEFVSIVAVVITGHADKDLRENNPFRKPGESHVDFEMRISGARASRAREALRRRIRQLTLGKSTPILDQIEADPRRMKIVPMGASDLLVANPRSESDRRLNRRIEIFLFSALVPDADPVNPVKPDPIDLPKRLAKCVELLKSKSMPSGPVQTQRMQCIFSKLKDNPSVNDSYVDSHESQPVMINGKQQNGLQDVTLSYGRVSDAELAQFILHAKDLVMSNPQFGTGESDDATIHAMDGLDRSMLKAIGFLDSHIQRFNNPTLGLFAADPAKLELNNRIHRLQSDPNSIYSCR